MATISNVDSLDGSTFEYYCATLLRKLGYNNIVVTPQSSDHGADILCYKNGVSYAIQCKRYSKTVGYRSVQEIYTAKAYYGKDFAVVMTNNYFSQQATEDANRLGVILWDRNVLSRMIKIAFGEKTPYIIN